MSAVRLARGATRRARIVKFEGCYHGHADGLLVKAGSGLATFGTPSLGGRAAPRSRSSTVVLPLDDDARRASCSRARGSEIAASSSSPCPRTRACCCRRPSFLRTLRDAHARSTARCCLRRGDHRLPRRAPAARASSSASSPTSSTLGKIVGGGMPVGAYLGARASSWSCSRRSGPCTRRARCRGTRSRWPRGSRRCASSSAEDVRRGSRRSARALERGSARCSRAHDVPGSVARLGSIFWLRLQRRAAPRAWRAIDRARRSATRDAARARCSSAASGSRPRRSRSGSCRRRTARDVGRRARAGARGRARRSCADDASLRSARETDALGDQRAASAASCSCGVVASVRARDRLVDRLLPREQRRLPRAARPGACRSRRSTLPRTRERSARRRAREHAHVRRRGRVPRRGAARRRRSLVVRSLQRELAPHASRELPRRGDATSSRARSRSARLYSRACCSVAPRARSASATCAHAREDLDRLTADGRRPARERAPRRTRPAARSRSSRRPRRVRAPSASTTSRRELATPARRGRARTRAGRCSCARTRRARDVARNLLSTRPSTAATGRASRSRVERDERARAPDGERPRPSASSRRRAPRIFEPFVRGGDEQRRARGRASGLGLYHRRRELARAHGGEVARERRSRAAAPAVERHACRPRRQGA